MAQSVVGTMLEPSSPPAPEGRKDLDGPDDILQLHEISTFLIQDGNLDFLHNRILDAAIGVMSSNMASMQLLDPESNKLRLLASKGFHPQSAIFWEWVYLDSASTCGIALSSGGRVVVPDVETCDFMAGTSDLDEYRRSNIRAVQSTPLVSRSGQLLGMISTHWREPHQPQERALRRLDVIARQAADLIERSRTEARLGGLLTLSYEPMLVWQLNGSIEFWNAGAERLYGFTPDEAMGRSSHALLQTKFPVKFDDLITQLQNERYWSGELRQICKHGREVIVESRLQLLGDGTVIEVNRDVTERRKIEADLREFASIIQTSDDAIVSTNLDGIIKSWNKGAERLFGYTAEEAAGQPITLVVPQDRHNEERTILTRIRRGGSIEHFETVRQRKDGSLIWVSLTISPVKNAEGKIVGASKIARDITQQKRSQEQIATLAREAEHRSKNLLANVQAMVNLSQADAVDDLKKAIEGRIQALANVHSLFVATRWIGAELSTIAAHELAPYSTREQRVRIDGPQVLLAPDTAQAVAVTLHELATNAVKYGALSTADGRIDLKWSQEANGRLNLRWIETGGPTVQPPTRRGFGGRIIKQMIAQLKGESRFDWRAEGLTCEITLRV